MASTLLAKVFLTFLFPAGQKGFTVEPHLTNTPELRTHAL